MSKSIDAVVVFNRKNADLAREEAAWKELLKRIQTAGFKVDLLNLSKEQIAVLVNCPDALLESLVTEQRARDWIVGVPTELDSPILPRVTKAERLRMVHTLLTGSLERGGCGVYAKDPSTIFGPYVEAVFPLHDLEFNKRWFSSLSKAISDESLAEIRDEFGEDVAYYFYFERFYVRWLILPSIMAVISYFFLGEFSAFYGLFIVMWSVIFLAAWEKKQRELSKKWKTLNCTRSDWTSQSYRREKDILPRSLTRVLDTNLPVTRWFRRTMTAFPILFSALLLMILNFVVFSVETWATEYTSVSGIWKTLAVMSPTLVYNLAVGPISKLLTKMAQRLNDYENHPTEAAKNAQLNNKLFLLQAITGFSYTLFVIYIYIPLAGRVSILGKPASEGRLRDYVVWYMVTAQLINFVTETIVPVVMRRFSPPPRSTDALTDQILRELSLPVYNPNEDYAEMASQFGYLVLFSLAYEIVAVASYVNNIVEIRSDAFKVMRNMQKPWPSRVEGIGNWLGNMRILAFIGAMTNATIWTMFSNSVRQAMHAEGRLTKDGKTFVVNPLAMLVSTFVAQLLFVVLNNLAQGVAFASPDSDGETWDKRAKLNYLASKGILLVSGKSPRVTVIEPTEDQVAFLKPGKPIKTV